MADEDIGEDKVEEDETRESFGVPGAIILLGKCSVSVELDADGELKE